MRSSRLLIAGLVLLLAGMVSAHIRLTDPTTLLPLAWPNPAAIEVVISAVGSDDMDPGEHVPAMRAAIATWNEIPESGVTLVENTSPAQRARTDFGSFDLHSLFFDENDESGFFPPSSGIVAVTPVTFTLGGSIVDADVIFNGDEFRFANDGSVSAVDLQDVTTHELGHLLGLDHTGTGGATMYPFVVQGDVLHRSLAADDRNGAVELAPTSPPSRITGTVLRAVDSTPVSGAHVTATDASGRSLGGTLTSANGDFELVGLPFGPVELAVHPLHGPVGEENLAVAQPIDTDFAARRGVPLQIVGGVTQSVGTIFVPVNSFLRLGSRADPLPLRAIAGQTSGPFSLGANGLGSFTTLETSDPNVTVQVSIAVGSSLQFQLVASPAAVPGNVDLIVTRSGTVDYIPGAVEVTPVDPTVDLISPDTGDRDGGALVRLTGTGFNPGASVVLGGRLYRDGAGAQVLDASTIDVTLEPSELGRGDVRVIDPSGVQAFRFEGFRVTAIPAITGVFPAVASAGGNSTLTVRGADFDPDVSVSIDGVPQSMVRRDESTLIVTTTHLSPGPRTLAVQNAVVAPVFANIAVAAGDDPRFDSVSPTSGRAGTRVVVTGTGFTNDVTLLVGGDPDTSSGAVEALDVEVLSSTTLEATVPSVAAGASALFLLNTATGQATVTSDAFMVEATPSSGGGGGCYTVPAPPGPPTLRDVLAGSWWFLALAFLFLFGTRSPRPNPARVGVS